jgi:hypothetical protein
MRCLAATRRGGLRQAPEPMLENGRAMRPGGSPEPVLVEVSRASARGCQAPVLFRAQERSAGRIRRRRRLGTPKEATSAANTISWNGGTRRRRPSISLERSQERPIK